MPPLLGASLESGGVASVETSCGRPCLEARMEWDLTALRAQASRKAEDINPQGADWLGKGSRFGRWGRG